MGKDFSTKFQPRLRRPADRLRGKAPIVPLHTWLPMPTAKPLALVHMLLAGILLKMGGYAPLRLNVQLPPEGHAQFAPLLVVLGW